MKNLILTVLPLLFFTLSCSTGKQNEMKHALLLTGNDHPAHKWQETTPVIKSILEKDSLFKVTISENPEDLATVSTDVYDVIVLNYCNWKNPDPLSDQAKSGFLNYLENGGGLMILHFANGAFHYSLPEAGDSDWPEYRKIVHQVWDHDKGSVHDKYGEFKVEMTDINHPITKDLEDFQTEDELYYNQVGEEELSPLFEAVSKDTGEREPLAWTYTYKNARVFQSLLGHGADSYEPEAYREILRRAAQWVSE